MKNPGLLTHFVAVFVVSVVGNFVWPLSMHPTYGPHPRFMAAKTDLGRLSQMLDGFETQTGVLPDSLAELAQGSAAPITPLPRDPWGHPYIYTGPLRSATLVYSSGKDGVDERGEGDDIIVGAKRYTCEGYGVDCPRSVERLRDGFLLIAPPLSLLGIFGCLIAKLVRRARLNRSRRQDDAAVRDSRDPDR
jgi:Type II secretion system (T2SS), protein G